MNIRKECGGVMLKGVKAKIGIVILGILVFCGSAIGIVNTFADPNYSILTVEVDPFDWDDYVVELDGENGDEFNIRLIIDDTYYIARNATGSFNVANPYITASSCSGGAGGGLCDVNTGHFSLEYNGNEPLYNLFTMHYNISPDTPAGVYDLSVNINNFQAQSDNDDPDEQYYIDLAEITPRTDVEITVKRPQEIIFEDSDGNPITEITKYLGDEDFIVNKHTISGEGDISDLYIDYGYDEDVVDIDSDYIQILNVGTTRICAWASEAGLYLDGESCFTVNVEKKPILTYSMYIYDEEYVGETIKAGPIIVELNGTDNVRIAVELEPINTIRLLNMHGYFATSENPWSEYGPHYINATDFYSMSICEEQCGFDVGTGSFYYEFNDINDDGNWFEEGNEEIARMIYTISSDTPVGVYYLPIVINDLQGRNMDDGTDFNEEYMSFENVQVMVRRPQNIVFSDENDNHITEINKTYGDSDFIITKAINNEGNGEIIDYYIESSHSVDESEGNVVDIVPNSDYIHINKAGSAEICAVASETEFYLETTTCYTINVESKEIWVKDLTVADKLFDGNSDAEVDELTFYTLDSEDQQVDINIDPAYYYIDKVELDDPNVGETIANIEIYLTTEGYGRYYLSEAMYTAPARVVSADISDTVAAGIPPQTYDPSVNYQPVLAEVSAKDGEILLEEGVDYELLYYGQKLYDEIWLTDVGDYDISISPIDGSNYTFTPFEATFTIYPKELTIAEVNVDNKTFDNSYDASVIEVVFNEEELVKDRDYWAYANLESSDVGTWRAMVYVSLYNSNYGFYDEYDPSVYVDQVSLEVDGVEIYPRELRPGNSSVYFLDGDGSYTYTGEEIKPLVHLAAGFTDGDSFDDYHELYYEEDYTIEYPEDTINSGGKSLNIVGIGNFCGSIPLEYYIEPASIENVSAMAPSQTYTGEPLEPEPVITATFNGDIITLPEADYVIYHDDSFVDANDHYSYAISQSANGNYYFDTFQSGFVIEPYVISSSDISLSENVYKHNGTSQTPSVTVTVGNSTIDENDYEVEYSADTIGNDESDTTVTVTVTAKEGTNITGSASTTYVITPRDVLTISGIEDNQQIEYTGSAVVIDGDVVVEENTDGITADDLTVNWYDGDGITVIDRPTNAGSYKVIYSYEDANYSGALVVNFEITKAVSPNPAEMSADFRIASGKTLADLEGERTNGFAWGDSSATIISGNNVYPATYTYNNDAVNYETLTLNVPVYGLAQVNVTISESEGGEISVSSQNILEGETVTVTIAPDFGYTLSRITVNGVDHIGGVDANTLTVVAGVSDIEIVATFVPIVYEVVEGAEQVYTVNEDNGAEFRINAVYELFENGGAVYVDDVLVDPKNYTSWDGSTYIQFADDYLNTLAVGTHTLKVIFNDGGTVTTTFTIAKSESEDENKDEDENEDENDLVTPNTGFFTLIGGGVTTTIGLPVIAFITLAVTFIIRRRKNLKRNT